MDMLDVFIIAVATITAIAFKVFLYKRIQKWMDQDLIKGLAEGNSSKHAYLNHELQRLTLDKTPRRTLHEALTESAKHYTSKKE
ncbi:hypothetical protein [Neptunomonas japonica]|uniref:hypothetical protein n=1 Tax=Neptunomonas japonica TaxID=417574 RepID=UPI0004218EB7|nr:hypothetical protein [Neptunomonas japonica]